MIEYLDLYELLKNKFCISLNNKSSKNIVFFGNCQIIPMAHYLNSITKEYNIHIILSWLFQKEGYDNFDMVAVNNKISSLIIHCEVFIYHKHIGDYGIGANIIENIVPKKATKIQIPNLQLHYNNSNTDAFYNSLNILKYSIETSDLKNFIFMYNKYKQIRFFNTNEHPTHFILYLMALQLYHSITKTQIKIRLQDYYSEENREQFKKIIEHAILPGNEPITHEIHKITKICIDVDYFDILSNK